MKPLTKTIMAVATALALILAGCGDDDDVGSLPPPHELTAQAIGHFCGMGLMEHSGPKGQILLRSSKAPIWFSSARDALAFTMLPGEPKDIRAIYVSDMGHVESWDHPGVSNWTDARKAFFVIGSRRRGGMGAEEAVPFSERAAAERFVAENGGRVVAFDQVPEDYILTGAPEAPAAVPDHHTPPAQHAH